MSDKGFYVQCSELATPYFARALECQKAGDMLGALRNWEKIIEIDRNTDGAAAAYTRRGMIFFNIGDFVGALTSWEQALRFVQSTNIKIELYDDFVRYYVHFSQFENAIYYLTKLLEISGGSARSYGFRATLRYNLGDIQGTISDFKQAINIEPNNYLLYHDLALYRLETQDVDGALADFTKALQLEQRDHDVFFRRGNLLYQMGRNAEALADLNQAIKLEPNSSRNLQCRAMIYYALDKVDLTISNLAKAIELDPKSSMLYAQRSIIYTDNVGLGDALRDAEIACSLDSNNWFAYFARGRAHEHNSLFAGGKSSGDKAVQDLTRCIELNPSYGDAYGYRSSVYTRFGQHELAFRDLKVAIRYTPFNHAKLEDNWTFLMQMVVNALANDGYTIVELDMFFIGPVGYKEVIDTYIYDLNWDDYLKWRIENRNAGRRIVSRFAQENVTSSNPDAETIKLPNEDATEEEEIKRELSIKYQDEGLRLKRNGNLEKSILAYRHAIKADHTDPQAYFGFGKTCYLANQGREAIRCYLSVLHLSLGNMIRNVQSDPYSNVSLQTMQLRKQFEELAGPQILFAIRTYHLFADFLWLQDDNCQRHLAHVIVDLNKGVEKSQIIKRQIQNYHASIIGKASFQLDEAIEENHYQRIGRQFALDNIQWNMLHSKRPFEIYLLDKSYNFERVKEMISSLP